MDRRQVFGYAPPAGSNERTRLLRLKVLAGHNLAKKDIFGASDPYLRIDLIDRSEEVEDTVVTKTKKRTLNPKWSEEFVFRVKPDEHKLVLEVFDENRLTRDDFLGMVELPLANLPKESTSRQIPHKYYILRPRSARSKVRGHLELYHAYITDPDDDDVSAEDNATSAAVNRSNIIGVGGDTAAANAADWEVVATANPPSLTIDGTDVASNEPFIVGQENEASLTAVESVTDASDGSSGLDATPPLPPAWEERQDANGRTYYVSHVTRSTQWQHPGLAVGAVGGPLPEETYSGRRQRVHISADDSRRGSRVLTIDNDGGIGSLSINEAPGIDSLAGAAAESPDHTDAGGAAAAAAEVSLGSGGATEGASGGANASAGGGQRGVASEGLPPGWTLQVAPNGRVFFINHGDKKTTWVDPRSGRPSRLPSQNNLPNRKHEDDLGPLPEGWEERVHTDGRIFFIDHNTRATQWEDPRISDPGIAGPAIPYNRDYKRKYEFLKTQLKKPHNVPNKIEIKVRRAHILEDSFRQVLAVSASKVDVLKTKLWIEFDGEIGLDYGGVAREWFYLLSKEMFNPYYGLFEYSATDNYTLQINPNSGVCTEDHLSYFKFIGRVAGMAVYHGKLLDGFFIRPFYKMMLGKAIELKDMESVDTEYFNSLMWIKENDPTELELTFQVDEENFGKTTSRDLKLEGGRCPVTNENKHEYIQLVIMWRFVSRIQNQMDNFLAGFKELVPLNLLKIFDEGELELLMCGIGAIDVKDWKQYTVYKGDYHHNHIVIQWFWRVVLSFNNEMRSRLLQFVTGTSRVPMNGFKELYGSNGPQPFTIEKWGNPNSFPRAHTCFNRLDLPPYDSYQQLKDRLIRAIEGSEGFSGVD